MVAPPNRSPSPPRLAKIGGDHDPLGGHNNLRPESFYGPNAGLTEVPTPAGYVTTVCEPVFALSPDGSRYLSVPSHTPIKLPPPGFGPLPIYCGVTQPPRPRQRAGAIMSNTLSWRTSE